MTSLDHDHEHETHVNQNTTTECDWDSWETGEWGDLEQQPLSGAPTIASNSSPSHSPKAQEPWISLEEKPVCILIFRSFHNYESF